MTPERFNALVDERIRKIRAVLAEKSKEYSRNNDRLHNFKRGAQMEGKSVEEVLEGMALKQKVSMKDILDDIEDGKLPTIAMLDEKMGDVINYCILLEACIIERIEARENV